MSLNFCGLRCALPLFTPMGHPSLPRQGPCRPLFMASLHLALILALFPGASSRIFSFGHSLSSAPKASLMLRT